MTPPPKSRPSSTIHHDDLVILSLVGQSRTARKSLELLVELRTVVTGTGTKYASTTNENRRIDVTDTAAAATFLLVELAG